MSEFTSKYLAAKGMTKEKKNDTPAAVKTTAAAKNIDTTASKTGESANSFTAQYLAKRGKTDTIRKSPGITPGANALSISQKKNNLLDTNAKSNILSGGISSGQHQVLTKLADLRKESRRFSDETVGNVIRSAISDGILSPIEAKDTLSLYYNDQKARYKAAHADEIREYEEYLALQKEIEEAKKNGTDWGKLAWGALEKSAGQMVSRLTSLGEGLLGGVTDEVMTLGANMFGIDASEEDIKNANPFRYANKLAQDQVAADERYFYANSQTSRAAELIDKYGTMVAYCGLNLVPALMSGGGSLLVTGSAEGLRAMSAIGNASKLDQLGLIANQAAKKLALNPAAQTSFVTMAGSNYQEAINDGQDEATAIVYGLLTGAIDAMIEVGGVDEALGGLQSIVKKVSNKEKSSLYQWAKSAMLEEGGEEIFQGVVDRAGKYLYDNNIPLYSATDDRAVINPDTAWQEFSGGALVGGIVGGGHLTVSKGIGAIETQKAKSKRAESYRPYTSALVEEALELNPDDKFAKGIQAKLDGDKKVTTSEISRLIDKNEKTMSQNDISAIKNAAAERLAALGETQDIDSIAEAIADKTSGRRLTLIQQQAIVNSAYGQRVINELEPENISSGEYSTEWAQKIGTDKINAQEYSKLISEAMINEGNAADQGGEVSFPTVKTPQAKPDGSTVSSTQSAPLVSEAGSAAITAPATAQAAYSETASREDEQSGSAVTVEDASKKYGAQAGAMLHTYETGQDVEEYDAAYKIAYDYGYTSVPFDAVKDSRGIAYLSENQRRLAYDTGAAASDASAKASEAANDSKANGKAARKTGAVKGQGVTVADLKKTFNDSQGSAYGVLSTIAEATGIDIVLYNSEANGSGKFEDAQGSFKWKDDTIYIDINAGLSSIHDVGDLSKYTMLRTFSHEFTHFIEKWNPVQYNEFRKTVFAELTNRGENVDELILEKQEAGLTYDEASREVVAEAMTDILPDSGFVQKLAENHTSIFQKLMEKLKEFVSDIKAHYAAMGKNRSREANALKEQIDSTIKYVDGIVSLFDKCAAEAVESYQRANAVDELSSKEETAPEAKRISEDEAAPKSEAETPYTSVNGYTVASNPEYNSIEVSFDSKPSEAVRDTLKENKFRWNGKKRVWYGKTDSSAIIAAIDGAIQSEKSAVNENVTEPASVENIEDTVTNYKEVRENGAEYGGQTDSGAALAPGSDGAGAPRLLEEVENGDVRGDVPGGDASGSSPKGGREIGRAGDRPDAQRSGGGRSEGSGESSDIRRDARLTEEPEPTAAESKKPEALHEEVQRQVERQSAGNNFVISESFELPNGAKSRYKANLDAIRIVKQLEAENRYATAVEQEALSKYVGWGGIPEVFGNNKWSSEARAMITEAKPGWEREFSALKELLTDEEYSAARASTKNAHYTDISVIKAMYYGLQRLGFTGGRMLEPSSGVGNFVGAMPTDMSANVNSWTMIELDSITGLIAKHLYPNADVRIQGFEKSNIPNNYIDVAIGNVPFGDYAITDKAYPSRVKSAIHNYFFAKTLDKVRPGGIVMFITSSYTLNGKDEAVRKYIMERADLLGAIRLPYTAFKSNAGTEVVTDILVLKKRAPGTEYAGEDFLEAPYQSIESYRGANVNVYFANHPEMVLGTPTLSGSMYGGSSLNYEPFTDRGSLSDQIKEAFGHINGKMDYSAPPSKEKTNFAVERECKKAKRNSLVVKSDGKAYRDEDGTLVEISSDKATVDRISGLLGIRGAYNALVTALQQGQKDSAVKKARKDLNSVYDSFVAKHGYINTQANKNALFEDPDRYSLLSLENYNSEKKTAAKADIFTVNTISPNRTVTSAEDVATGIIVSMNETGRVDTALIARLTGKTEQTVTRELIDGRLAYKNGDGVLEAAETYLSGNVRSKLREAEALAPFDKDYDNNVKDLKAIIPKDIPYQDIYCSPGAAWVPASVYSDFVAHMLGGTNDPRSYRGPDIVVSRSNETGNFTVDVRNARLKSGYQNTQKWGTKERPFIKLFDALISSRSVVVKYKTEDGSTVVDKVATDAANEKMELISKEFQDWLWRDETRRSELESLYNETFNAIVNPKYNGEHLTVNGANALKPLRAHQRDAVARIVASGGNTLIAHKVGAGKTYEMAAAAMKLKQLGLIKKPMFTVPKALVAQWGAEFKDFFPTAKLLVADEKSFTPANRKTFINRIANGEYDAIILSYEQFEKIPMSPNFQREFYEEQISEVISAIAEEKAESGGRSLSIKDMEKKRSQLQAKIDKLTDKVKDDDNIDFEMLGVDSLFVDEAHNFKNLEYTSKMTNIAGLGNKDGAKRSFDLYTKVRYLQRLTGGRGIVFATATPIMNSMSEMYIMQKYLQPDRLKQLNLSTFDAWAKQFGEVVNTAEIKPSGQGFRVKQVFSRFRNLNELQLLFRSFTDVLTKIPGLKVPKMKGGRVNVVVCEPGQFQKDYMTELEKRADNIKNVDPSVDNMLKITSDGRKVSYTQRMIDPSLPYEPGCKIYRCCDNVLGCYKASKKIGGTQLIFCDMATPKGKSKKTIETEEDEMDTESARLYDDIRARLIQKGIPAKEIAFIHDADTDAKKKKLFEDVNDGSIRVLIGSTGKMGVGMNAQKRIVAVHHLDAPWRPGDVEQRNGRAYRQGNINDEVECFTYVTEGSFDARLWDILERKQNFIDQIMEGDDVGRSAEDTGDITLSAAEVKALASGNPLIMEQVQLNNDLQKLDNLRRAHNSDVIAAAQKLKEDETKIAALTSRVANAKEDAKARKDTYSDDKFSMTIGKKAYSDKKDAGVALAAEIEAKAKDDEFTTIGKFAGFELRAMKEGMEYKGLIFGKQGYGFNVYTGKTTYMINHMIAVVEGLDGKIERWQEHLNEAVADRAAQQEMISKPFARQAELDAKRARYNEVMEILNPKEEQSLDDLDDENTQYQSRKYLEDETEPKYNKRSKYSETETLFMMWQNGSAPVGEVRAFSRLGQLRFYEKTDDGCVELSSKQYVEKGGVEYYEDYKGAKSETDEAADYDGASEAGSDSNSYGTENNGEIEAVSRQALGKELRDDAGRSVPSVWRSGDGASELNAPVSQAISSAKTSIKQIPALFRDKNAHFGKTNIDIGGGRFDLATDYLASIGTSNLVFDPYNRSNDVNSGTLAYLQAGYKADTATCANVLNVISEADARANVVLEVAKAIKPDGTAYFMVYEGDGSGTGKQTGAGYQNNRKTADYMSEIEQYFNNVERKGKLIIATDPKSSLPKAAWEVTPGNAIQYQQRTSPLTDREVLSIAANDVRVDDLTPGEADALRIFRSRLDTLYELQETRAEQGRLYKKQQFGASVSREEAQKTLNRMHVLDDKIKAASASVLDVQEKEVLKRVLQKSRKVIEKEERAHGRELVQRYRDRRDNAAAIKKYRAKIKTNVDSLSKWILHPDNKKAYQRVPDALKNTVIPFLGSIDFTSKRQLNGGEATAADKEFVKRLKALKSAMKQNIDTYGQYSGYNDLPEGFLDSMQNFIDTTQELVENNSGEFVINKMTAEELKALSKVVQTLKKYITQMNRFHANAMYQHVFEAGDNTIASIGELGNAGNTGIVSNYLLWQQMRPAYAFERFGEGGKAIYDSLRQGQSALAFNTIKITEFAEKAYTDAEVKAWEKGTLTFTLGGDTVSLPVSYIMGFYELSKRPEALGHILGSGVRVATYKAGKATISDVGHELTLGDVSAMIDALTPRQKEVADALQRFMAEQGGKWGNHVSVARFGEEQFTDEHYYPINSDGRILQSGKAEEDLNGTNLYTLLNMSFTKPLQEGANNRIVLYSIFDVFANHMASMAQYNALALPVLDAVKWFNYQQIERDENGKKVRVLSSVREQMCRAFGVPEEKRPGSGRQGYAESFVLNILKAFNGTEAQGVPTDETGLKALHRYNMAAVAFNFRVVVQQPMAITRAGMLIDYSSIIRGTRLKPSAIKANIDEMKKYSGIAAWKSLGFYDVNIIRGLADVIKHSDSFMDKLGNVGMWGAEKADTLTWAAMWSACKEEVAKKQHLTEKDGAAFYEAVTKLFEDVVYKTQVVDSVLTKNEFLRSKGAWTRLIGSFMSEPTTTASMLLNAYDKYSMDMQRGMSRQQAWKRNRELIVRTTYVYCVGVVLLAAVQSIEDALRDDDDYETFLEKWLEAFGGNLIDEAMPFNKLPILRDFYELTKSVLEKFGVDTYGNESRTVIFQWADPLIKAIEIFHDRISGEDTNYTWYGGAYKLLQGISGLTGAPMANITRELVTAWNSIVGAFAPSLKAKTYDAGDMANIKYAYKDGYLTAEEATGLLTDKGLVDDEDDAYWLIRQWDDADGRFSRYDKLYDALRNGGNYNDALRELIDHGYTEKQVYSAVRSKVCEWYTNGEISKAQAESMLGRGTDMDSDEIAGAMTKWKCKADTGIDYGEIADAYMSGKISAEKAVGMYVKYGGYSQDSAQEKVNTLKFVNENPECDGISYAAVTKYHEYCEPTGMSAGDYYSAWRFYNDTSADVDSNGKAIANSKKTKVLDYINSLSMSSAQKDALYYSFGWAESKICEAPWH